MKKLLLTLSCALFSLSAMATIQQPDFIWHNGQKYKLSTYPLNAYLRLFPEKEVVVEHDAYSTNLWRGYIATFELVGDELFVKDVIVQLSSEELKEKGLYRKNYSYYDGFKSVLRVLFPEGTSLKADWYSGILVCPYGRIVKTPVYTAKYLLLEIKDGILVKTETLNKKQYLRFLEKQREAYKQSQQ